MASHSSTGVDPDFYVNHLASKKELPKIASFCVVFAQLIQYVLRQQREKLLCSSMDISAFYKEASSFSELKKPWRV